MLRRVVLRTAANQQSVVSCTARFASAKRFYTVNATKVPELQFLESDIAVYAQPSEELIKRAATSGFKSMINLRFPQEEGYLPSEEKLAKAAGLSYANIPFSPAAPVIADVRKAVEKMDAIPKPILVHCAGAKRAAVVALAHMAKRDKLNVQQTMELASRKGVELSPGLTQLLKDLVEGK